MIEKGETLQDIGIQEYAEGNRIALAYLQMSWMAGSIFISASFAIFGLSFSMDKPSLVNIILTFLLLGYYT